MAFQSSLIFWETCISQNTRLTFPKSSYCGTRKLAHSRCFGGPSRWHSLSILFLLSSGLWGSILVDQTGLHFYCRTQMPDTRICFSSSGSGGSSRRTMDPVEITPLLASLLVLRSGSKSVSALFDAIVPWLAFHGTDFIGSGHQVSVQTPATVIANSVNSTASVRPYCIS